MILNRVVWISLSEKVIFEHRLKETAGQSRGFSVGKVFQAEGAASAKALRWDYAQCVVLEEQQGHQSGWVRGEEGEIRSG